MERMRRFVQILLEAFAHSAPYYAMPYFIRAYPYHRMREDRR